MKRIAFAMAEILLSLTIIGVVAAITLPSLTGNINERTWNTQRKALYARMSQAIALMPALNGFGNYEDATSSTSAVDTVAETFVASGLSKVLKINNICDNEHLTECGFASKINTLAGSTIDLPLKLTNLNPNNAKAAGSYNETSLVDLPNTKAVAFETQNGESILTFYNHKCTSLIDEPYNIYMQKKVCANFIYDLNGSKGPNTFGKDIGIITVFYPTDSSVVAPYPKTQDAAASVPSDSVSGICKAQDEEYRMPSREELASMAYNRNIIGNLNNERYWSSTLTSSLEKPWYVNIPSGVINQDARFNNLAVRCVKR